MLNKNNKIFIDIAELHEELLVYSGADELSVSFEGEKLAFHFYFYKLDLRVHVDQNKDAFSLIADDFKLFILDKVSEAKIKAGITQKPQDDIGL